MTPVAHDLIAVSALALGAAPLGVMLMLRRLSLMSDALSHAVLPGVALAILMGATAAWMLMLGAALAALTLAASAALVTRMVPVPEDTSFAALYLPAFALGVLALNATGHSAEVLHILFGAHTGTQSLPLPLIAASVAVLGLALLYRPLLAEGVDPHFLRARGQGTLVHIAFTCLVAVVLVANFRAFGALMTAGMMVVPAASARLITDRLPQMFGAAVLLALLAGLLGVAAHTVWQFDLGPAVCAAAGALYLICVLFGPAGGIVPAHVRRTHLSG
jgi:zinc/manganese transport system permease protein